jgi:DNA-binding response OmpR family regulator
LSPDISRRTGRLLIIDDDQGVRTLFARILKARGHDVHTAPDADEGLREISTFRPDALLLDLRMPLINGFGFLYRLRIDPELRQLPVAIVTGDTSLAEPSLKELRALGAEVWHKPLSIKGLVGLADRLLAGTLLIADGVPPPPDAALSA